MTALEFAGGLLVILAASELFTNAVEWAGFRLRLGTGATGSLLAALGTALPETVVPIVALAGRGAHADAVAIGAVIGGPFLLLTLGMAFTGLAAMARRSSSVVRVDAAQARRDLGTFLAGFSLLAIALVLPLAGRIAVGALLLLLYARHVVRTLGAEANHGEQPEPLHLLRWQENPHGAGITAQLALGVAMLILGAHLFVAAIQAASGSLGITPLVLAVLLVPVATELPETLNSVLWVRTGDDTLAVGNVAGATAFQACIPGAIGVCLTVWRPGSAGLINGAVTLAAGVAAFALLRDGRCTGWRLALLGAPWLAYAVAVLALGSRLSGVP